jgi:Uma2 family endonuclease
MSESMPVAETAFCSDARFDQASFRRWLDERPASDINHYELIDGRIVMTPPAGWPHGRIDSRINQLAADHVERHRLGIVLGSSAGYDLPSGDTLEPDASFIAAERLATSPQPAVGTLLTIVPTLVIEILSPATSHRDRTEKKAVYERNGVAEYWIVDPVKKTITVFTLGGQRYGTPNTITAGPIASRVLPHLRVSVEQVFDLGV